MGVLAEENKGEVAKTGSKWIEPCYVMGRVGEVVYRMQLAPQGRTVVLHRHRMAPHKGSGQPAIRVTPTRPQKESPQPSLCCTSHEAECTFGELDTGEEVEPSLERHTVRGKN